MFSISNSGYHDKLAVCGSLPCYHGANAENERVGCCSGGEAGCPGRQYPRVEKGIRTYGANVKIYLFTCSTSLETGDLLDVESALPDTELKIVSVPCSGKIDVPYLVKAFESGAGGVMVVTCRQDECQYIQGGFRARNRVRAVDDLVGEIGLGQGRIALASLSSSQRVRQAELAHLCPRSISTHSRSTSTRICCASSRRCCQR